MKVESCKLGTLILAFRKTGGRAPYELFLKHCPLAMDRIVEIEYGTGTSLRVLTKKGFYFNPSDLIEIK